MDNIVVADKSSSTLSAQPWGNIQLGQPGVVQMPIAPGQVASVARNGQDLVLTLKSGEQITIGDFFAVNAQDVGSDLVFQGDDGTLWQAQYEANAFNGFTFSEVSSLDTLIASTGVVSGATQTFAFAGLGVLGAGGAAAAASSAAGGSGGGNGAGSPSPSTPSNLALSSDGQTLSGTGTPGSTINVRDPSGNLLGSAPIGTDGNFTIGLNPPLTNGEQLVVEEIDPSGNASGQAPVSAPDTTAPDTPANLQASADGQSVTGTGEPGATVIVRDANGVALGSAVVGDDGTFSVPLDSAQTPGAQLSVEQSDSAGNTSAPATLLVSDPASPAQPADLALSADGLQLSGTGQAGATVSVRAADGTLLGSAVVGADGRFSVPLANAQLNGQTLSVQQVDADGRVSLPTSLTAADVTAPAAPGNLQLAADGASLSGTGEPGATVNVRAANGSMLGSALVASDGTFTVTFNTPLSSTTGLSISQTDAAGNTSANATTPPTGPGLAAPTDLALSQDGLTLSGRGVPGAQLSVRGANGQVLGSSLVNSDGSFSVSLNSAQLDGQALSVSQSDAQGRTSPPASLTAPDVTAPQPATGLQFDDTRSSLSGRVEAGATVKVLAADGSLLGSAVAAADGSFTISFATPLSSGDVLGINVTDRAQNSSATDPLIVPDPADATPPAAPAVLAISSDGRLLSGSGEAGARVQVLDAQGNTVGSAVVGLDGQFSVELRPAQLDGQVLGVTLTDSAGNMSANTPVQAPTAPQQPQPLSDISVAADGLSVSGKGLAGLRVFVRTAAGRTLGSSLIGTNGTFTVVLAEAQLNGEPLNVVAVDSAGNSTVNEVVQAPDTDAPLAVSDLVVSPDGSVISGRGQPGANVTVRDDQGNVVASGVVADNGTFILDLDTPAAEGVVLSVSQTDASGLPSPATDIQVPDASGPVAVENVSLDGTGTEVSGNGVPGTRVEVRDANGNVLGSAPVGADGTFQVELSNPQTNGERLDVVVIDASGAESIPTPLQADDSSAPAQPSDLAVNPNGLLLSGSGEPGAQVTVRDAQGVLLGTAVVGETGSFSVPLSSAQTQGQALQVTLTDAQGNASAPLAINAPNSLGDLQPANLSLDSSGLQLSGTGQVGSIVSVRDSDGTALGTAQVGADGRFTVTLNAVQNNGQILQVVASAGAQTSSPTTLPVPDTQPPAAVTGLDLSDDRSVVSGSGEAGAIVIVRGANGVELGRDTVQPGGAFSVDLSPIPAASQPLSVVQVDPAGNVSPRAEIGAADTTPPDPVSNVVISANGSQVSGNGEVGARVQVFDAQDNLLGTGLVGANGRFEVTLSPAQVNGQALSIIQTDAALNESQPFTIDAPDIQPPAPPSDVSLAGNGLTLSGSGIPNASISVRGADGTLLGSGTVGVDGRFSFDLDAAQLNGERLQVTQSSSAFTSSPSWVTAVDVTAPEPVSNLQINASGNLLSGSGEVGAIVTVRDPDNVILGTALVTAEGSFSVSLNPPQVAGQSLSVVQTDPSANASPVESIAAPNLAPPASASDLALDSTGQILSGQAVVGATVQVFAADGTLITTGQAGPDGRFSIDLGTPRTNGEQLLVQVSVDGRSSPLAPYTADDTTPPQALDNLRVSPEGLQVSGTGEAGTFVDISVDGVAQGTASIGPDGVFVFTLPEAAAQGSVISLVARDLAGNTVPAVTLDGPDGSGIATPTALVLSADGTQLTGQASAGTTITVSNSQGVVLGGVGPVGADGLFSVTLIPAQTNGQLLEVVAEDGNGQVSVPGTLTAADTTAPLAPSDLGLSADGAQLSGRGEPGTRLSVKNAAGVELGSLTIGASGLFSVALTPAQVDGQALSASLTDAAGNTSPAATLNAPDLSPPAAPTELSINLAGTVVSGRGEPGTLVEVRDAQGTLLASEVVLPAGTFSVVLPAAQLTGAPLQVQLRDAADNLSPTASLATLDRTPPAPVTATDISVDGSQLTGQGEAGARVEVRSANGTLLGSGLVAANGQFAVNLAPAPANGETLAVVQVDAAGNASAAVAVVADDITAPEALSNVVINRDGLTVTGNGEPGATVFVRADGSELGRALVATNGSFSVTLSSAQINAQVLTVNQEDPPGNEGPSQQVIAPDLVAPLAPADLALNPSGLQLSGTAEAGSSVIVRDGAGQVIGNGVAAADGTFLLNLNQAQLNGQILRVTAQDAAGNLSPAGLYTAADVTAPQAVTALAVTPDGGSLTGLGEAGAQVEVRSADGSLLGSTLVGPDGRFSVSLTPPAQAGSLLAVLQSDAAGNVSPVVSVTTPGDQGPAVPTDLSLSTDGLVLTGSGSVGSTVSVRGPGGVLLGSALVIGDGSFSVNLASAQLNGERLEVSAQSNGLSSLPAELIATDSTAPLALADYRLAIDGVTLDGRGEPLATVQVLGAGGELLASVQVGADGSFSAVLNAPQQAGQLLSLTQTDAAGNVSPAVNLTAPDLVAPLAAQNLQLDGTGLVLSGTGEAGATVRVVGANGALLGSGVVLADGSFQIALSQAPVDGQALAVTLTDAAGNVSLPASLTPVDTTPPLPLTALEITTDGLTIIGRGEPLATVVVRAADGSQLGTAVVAANGAFSVTLSSAQTNAQSLSLTQSDQAGNLSPAVNLTAPDTTPPAALSDAQLNPLGTLVSGTGEPGATVQVTNTSGVLLGSAVVLADGSYSVNLQPAQIDLQVLRVNQVDAAGNPGPVITLTAPDLTPPAVAQELTLNAAGTQLSGRGEVNAEVMVLRADGTSAGTATVGSDGRFSVTLAPGSADGGVLQVILMDTAQNMSVPATFTTPDLLPPTAVSDLQFDVAGRLLVGNGEPYATVEALDGSTPVGSTTVGADGRFSLDLGTLPLQGQALTVVQRDAAGNLSDATPLQVPDLSIPAAPSDLLLAADGLTLTGNGLVGATVQVYGPDENLLGTVTVGSGGAFTVTLSEAQLNGELLQVRQISSAGVPSAQAPVQALDVTPAAPVTDLQLSADGLTLSGRGQANALVQVSVGGTQLGSVQVATDGSFQVPLGSAQLNGELLSVIQTDASTIASNAVTLAAPDLTPPAAPTPTAMTSAGSLQGTAEVGSTVTVRAQDGTLLGSGVAGDGTFNITLTPPQNTGALLSLVATDAAGNVSPVVSITALDTTPPDAILSASLAFSDDLSQISGLGEAGATVSIVRADGTPLGQALVAANGTFTLTFTGAVAQGEALRVIQTDAAGNPSDITSFAAPTVLPPSTPLNLVLNAEGTLLNGQASAGTTVTVRAQDGTSLGSAVAQSDGTFSVGLQPAQTNGQLLSVTASTASAGDSIPALLTAGDTTPPAALANLQLESGGTRVTGTGEVGARVTISNALGTELGSATVSASGTFSVTLSSPQLNGQLLSAVQADAVGNRSPLQTVQAPDLTAPQAAGNLLLNGAGTVLTGAGEVGASVRVVNASGVELGTGTVGVGGTFSINLNSAQTNGQSLTVTLTDAALNTSLPATLVAADTTAPLAPINLAVNAAGLQLTGNGEPGARVFVTSPGGTPLGNALVASDGSFTVLLSSAQLNFESLRVSQTDPAGNVSAVATVNAPDITPPAIATALSVSGTGTSLSGRGEVGASVTVRDALTNQVLGTGVIGSDGQFSVTLSPAQNDGQALTVQLTDARNNASLLAGVSAPDTTAPLPPAAVQVNATGTLVTGTGVVGDRIVVRDGNGTALGSAQVAANGSWAVVLSPAQVSGLALQVTQVDLAGNVSVALPVSTPDLTPPAAASGLQLSTDGLVLSGSAEVGATVTVKSATGTTLGSTTVGAGGGFSVNLNTAQINGEVLSISVTDRAGNLSPVVTLTAPDIDADRPVVANDNLATATVNLAAVTTRSNSTESIPVLLGLGLSHTVNFTVASGTTATPTLTLVDGGLLSLGTQATFTLQVKDASGAWVTLGNAGSGGLLNLSVLAGSGVQVRAGTLLAGEYRLTLATNSVSVATTINSNLQLDINSLTQFAGSAGATITGNVVTDPGPTGSVDITGPDNAAVVRIQNGNAGYVSAGSGTVVQGLYGALTIDAQGNYSYRPSGAASSVGKVDVFNYQLVHPNGLSDPAVLYVRIDSPQAAEVWSDTSLAAPALLLDAVNDNAATRISLGNLVTTETSTLGTASTLLSAINGAYTFSVANNTVSDLKMLLSATNLLSLLGTTTVELYKLNASNQYVLVKSVSGGTLLNLGNGQYGLSIDDQTAGSYRVNLRVTGVSLLNTVTVSLVNTATYTNQQVVTSYTPVSGNLLTDPSGGAPDTLGSALTVLSVMTAANTFTTPGYNGTLLTGTYGTLLVKADGSYTYTLKPGLSSAVVGNSDTFTYQLTHPNGSSDTATLTVALNAQGTASARMALASTDDDSANSLTLAAGGEVLSGADDADVLDGSQGGAVTLLGAAGDDTLIVSDLNFAGVDGGSGTDTLLWAGGDAAIDLSQLQGRLSNIEVIDLNDSSSVHLTLGLADLIAVTEPDQSMLLIKGGEQDSVLIEGSWVNDGTQLADGLQFTQYTSEEDPTRHLWVQAGIQVV